MTLLVNLSGGRSSGRMLRLLLDDGRFERGRDHAVFCNTGFEMPQTLDFLRNIETHWKVPVVWLEFRPGGLGFAEVSHATASRNGEPFVAAMLESHCGIIPKTMSRVCTSKLKIDVSEKWRKACDIDDPVKALGYRSDEPQRKARAQGRPGEQRFIFPLMEAGIDRWRVVEWWRQQAFDLRLPTIAGATRHGNCNLCFLKSERVVAELIAECPARADAWCDLEEKLEERRNQKDCRFWKAREQTGGAWTKCDPPPKPTEFHRMDEGGQWWRHDGRRHKITIGFQHISYRELRAAVVSGKYKHRRKGAPTFFDSAAAEAAMPCECGD